MFPPFKNPREGKPGKHCTYIQRRNGSKGGAQRRLPHRVAVESINSKGGTPNCDLCIGRQDDNRLRPKHQNLHNMYVLDMPFSYTTTGVPRRTPVSCYAELKCQNRHKPTTTRALLHTAFRADLTISVIIRQQRTPERRLLRRRLYVI